ncbi:hypothetical protein [Paraburkholderia bannensis]|uniref:hypothetical protein n=1 Tax=Paraburkholderia bannensis TaxID=765414 RepID=UPI002ABDCE70|nr:hypothetical protein [Paraburkholderia bannensis]
MSLNFEQEVRAVLAAQQVAIATALAIAAKQAPKPVDEIDSRLAELLHAGTETFSDSELRERYNREIRSILTRATMHITDDRPLD